MLFNFRLRPVDRIAPWSREGQSVLHWFGLTDGWYWMDVGTDQLFRYTDDILRLWGIPPDHGENLPSVDYQVVRLWEDLQEMLPSILEPIPERVLEQVQPGAQALVWRNQLIDYLIPETDVPDNAYDLLEHTTSWLDHRWLDVGYLQNGPRIWFWTQEQTVVIHWDNREIRVDDRPVWTAGVGSIALPLDVFIDEVRSFDRRLIYAMQERIAAIQQQWSRPDIALDVPALLREQQDRATWMERTLEQARHRPPTAWQDVLEIIERVKHGEHPH
jgi:hypothetical protein